MHLRLTPMESKEFGRRLRQAREAKHLTQGQLAKKMGTSHATVSNWENGKTKTVRAELLLKAANALNVKVDKLFYGIDEMVSDGPGSYESKPLLQEIVDAWDALSDSQKKRFAADIKRTADENAEVLNAHKNR